MLNRFKFKVQKLNMNFHFTLQEVEKKYNTCYHVLNPVGVNGGGGSRTHDTQITRRTLSERATADTIRKRVLTCLGIMHANYRWIYAFHKLGCHIGQGQHTKQISGQNFDQCISCYLSSVQILLAILSLPESKIVKKEKSKVVAVQQYPLDKAVRNTYVQ